ncbi:hypothetical protein [Lysobacter gummosus]
MTATEGWRHRGNTKPGACAGLWVASGAQRRRRVGVRSARLRDSGCKSP